jgi:dUTP pyrophosphatase
MFVNIKKLHEDAIVPVYAKEGDAGLDLVATSIISDTTYQVTYGTGLAVEIPKGYMGLIFPRSSVRNYQLTLSNSVGVIDSGYRGEIQVTFNKTFGMDSIKYSVGERVAQIVVVGYLPITFVEAKELGNTTRGTGGFGSTGL